MKAVAELFAWEGGELVRAKVTRCALARVCGACGRSLGRPIAFVATAAEVARNELHAPPMHATCAEDARAALDPTWSIVLTAGFEFVRPAKEDPDRAVRFVPNSLL